MDLLIDHLFSLPMVIFTVPMLMLAVIWLFTLLGLLDLEILDFLGGEGGADATDGASDNALSKLGLDGVPVTIAFTVLDFYGLAISYLLRKYLMPLLDGILTATATGALLAFIAVIVALPLTALCVKPFRDVFRTHEGERKGDLMGTVCTVKTQYVSETFGQAVGDNDMIFSIRASEPNDLKQGSKVILLEFDAHNDTYSVASEADVRAMSSVPHIN